MLPYPAYNRPKLGRFWPFPGYSRPRQPGRRERNASSDFPVFDTEWSDRHPTDEKTGQKVDQFRVFFPSQVFRAPDKILKSRESRESRGTHLQIYQNTIFPRYYADSILFLRKLRSII